MSARWVRPAASRMATSAAAQNSQEGTGNPLVTVQTASKIACAKLKDNCNRFGFATAAPCLLQRPMARRIRQPVAARSPHQTAPLSDRDNTRIGHVIIAAGFHRVLPRDPAAAQILARVPMPPICPLAVGWSHSGSQTSRSEIEVISVSAISRASSSRAESLSKPLLCANISRSANTSNIQSYFIIFSLFRKPLSKYASHNARLVLDGNHRFHLSRHQTAIPGSQLHNKKPLSQT